ncbi:hypothetical protein Lser_V15G27241 [Lactuca serriola]
MVSKQSMEFVGCDEEGKLFVNEKTMDLVKTFKEEIAVIGVIGSAGVGKIGTIMNECKGIKMAENWKPCTRGLCLWKPCIKELLPVRHCFGLPSPSNEGLSLVRLTARETKMKAASDNLRDIRNLEKESLSGIESQGNESSTIPFYQMATKVVCTAKQTVEICDRIERS